ncbi:MAG: hypothetical protein ABIR96_11550 [Bdellovibrionota bacterium]
MSGDLKKVSRRLGRGLSTIGVAIFAHASAAQSYADASKAFVDQLTYRAAQQDAQVNTIVAEGDRINDSGDKKVIEAYYNQIRIHYVAEPSYKIVKSVDMEQTLNTYVGSLQNIFSSDDAGIARANRKKDDNEADAIFSEVEFKKCVNNSLNFSDLVDKKQKVLSSLLSMQRSMETPYMFRAMDYSASNRWSGAATLSQGLAAFDRDLPSLVASCCVKPDPDLSSAKCSEYKQQATAAQEKLTSAFTSIEYPPLQYTPNPLDVHELSGQDLAEIITQRRAVLNTVRSKSTNEFAEEQDVFESMARCRLRAKQFQNSKKPLSYEAAFAAAKAVKCSLLPAYAAQNLETQWAKMSVAGVAVPIQGNGWDINCSANEAQAWNTIIDQSRDPSAWGIDQMANPPYIQSLRAMPPVATGLPMQGITADEYLMLTPTPGLDNYSTGANNTRTTVRPTNASVGARGGARSTAGATAFQSKVVRSESGVEKGQELVNSVRVSSSNIRNNDRSEFYASRLNMGAKNTLGFLQTGVARSKIIRSSSSSDTTQTNDVRRMVLRSTGTRASRTTSEGILGSLNNGTSSTPTTTGNITDIGAQNEAVQAQVKVTVQKYLDNIELTRTKAEAARIEILRLVGQYDSVMGEVSIDIQNQPPKKIAARIAEGRSDQMDLVNQLGVKRAEFDAYQAAINEQSSALSRLVTFGPMNGEISLDGASRGTTRGTSTGTTTGTSTTMPSGLDTSGRGSTRGAWNRTNGFADQLWAVLNPISSAWAATRMSGAEFQRFYASEWKRFVSQYGDYVEGLRKADMANSREAAQLISARKKSITLDNYTVIDVDTMTTIDMFLSELDEETGFLLDGQRDKQFKLSNDVIGKVQETRKNALKARDAWAEAQVVAFKEQPKSYEQDARLWWGFLPTILLQ